MLKKMNIVPKWMILILDLSVTQFAMLLAIVLQKNLVVDSIFWQPMISTILLVGIVNIIVFALMKTFSGIVRYTGLQDAVRIAVSILISSFVLFVINNTSFSFSNDFILGKVIIILYGTFSFLQLISYRVFVKFVFAFSRNYKMQKKHVVIFGAGEAGVATKRVLEHDTQNNINLLAFVDDDKKKTKKVLDGIPIISLAELTNLVKEQPIDELVIASFVIPTKRKNELVDFCLDHEIKILNVPPYSQWTEGSFASRQLRSIKIEELLERDTIHIDNEQIRHQIAKKRVLVTGAAGSIGSEIVRQLLPYQPEMIILCDQAESPLHALELELHETKSTVNFVPFLADITNEQRMEYLFEQFKPNYVYHAAAYKHVPMMEICPSEAIKNNIIGTKLIADLALKYKVERFVMVSTDKAVNPTNVMGASKRLAEIYVQGLSKLTTHTTRFITTRFGNVLGSNGSVIIRFKEQIENGGPVTVTHPNITRYFMTIPEACGLVLEAGSMGNGGEIFVFDMGQPVAIADLAKKMIRLYGLIPNIDINIKYTGLRPGEKLYEELLSDEESTVPTHHQKILIAKVRPVDFKEIEPHFNAFKDLLKKSESEMMLVTKMKEMVPEFVSNNSVFEKLDGNGKVVHM